MRFKNPLEQYLYRWFREKKGQPVIGGIIFLYDPKNGTDKLKFIQTSYRGYNTHYWHTHDRITKKPKDNWLEEYTPTREEKLKAIKTVFVLDDDIINA